MRSRSLGSLTGSDGWLVEVVVLLLVEEEEEEEEEELVVVVVLVVEEDGVDIILRSGHSFEFAVARYLSIVDFIQIPYL